MSAARERGALDMKALALTVALGLLAALQAQDPLALLLPEEQNVRLGWAGWGQGRGHPGWSGSQRGPC